MKKTILLSLVLVASLTSCTHSVYTTKSLEDGYNARMTTKKQLATKEKINVYFAEGDITQPYEVIAVSTYRPAPIIPLVRPFKKQMTMKMLQRSVGKAENLNGDAIVVMGPAYYKVVKFK